MDRTDRRIKTAAAVEQLPELLRAALTAEQNGGPDDPATLAAWEAVEKAGATVHRQSRLLAGKSKGG